MAITYFSNGQPYEACWACRGNGYTSISFSGRVDCMKCNGTGNELWICPPKSPEQIQKQKALCDD